jgi:hypothetical protein
LIDKDRKLDIKKENTKFALDLREFLKLSEKIFIKKLKIGIIIIPLILTKVISFVKLR